MSNKTKLLQFNPPPPLPLHDAHKGYESPMLYVTRDGIQGNPGMVEITVITPTMSTIPGKSTLIITITTILCINQESRADETRSLTMQMSTRSEKTEAN